MPAQTTTYTLTILVPKKQEQETRADVHALLQQVFAVQDEATLVYARDEGTLPFDPELVNVVVSIAVSIAANEIHSPRWIPAFRERLRSRFGASADLQERER